MILKLKGITQKGKNRVREHGEDWIVIQEKESVLFSNEPGPWLFVAPVGSMEQHSRWVHKFRDKDFDFCAPRAG